MTIKTWQERIAAIRPSALSPATYYMQAEIDELRAALAARPALVPMTDEQIHALFQMPLKDQMMRTMERNIARAVEAHHGIRKQEPTGGKGDHE